jgi:hypothetical protein
MAHLSSFVLVVSLLGSSLVGCGNSDDSSTNGAGGGSTSAATTATCYSAADKNCNIYGNDSGVASHNSKCTSGGGSVVDHCPSDGLVGCCLTPSSGSGECFYDATIATPESIACTHMGGTWATSAP